MVADKGVLVRGHKALASVVALVCAGLVGTGCGSDEEGGGDANGGNTTAGAKQVDPAAMESAKGEITYCTGKDTSGDLKEGIAEFNKLGNGVTVKLLEFPESADEQRNQFTQRQRAESGECDGFEADVIWTAEFASQGWLREMTPYVERRKAEFIPSTLSSVGYEGKLWGVPRVTDAALLYYRTDVIDKQPETWQETYELARTSDPQGIAYQGASYEGLTVDFLELAFAAGGNVLSDDGKTSEFDSPENVAALQFMVDGVKDGAAPKGVTTYMEEQARRAFEAGRVSVMRNWLYAYALGNQAPKIKGKFTVIPFPAWEGGERASVLGGHNMVISTYSKNPDATLKFIDYMTNAERMERNAVKYSKPPVLETTYQDADVKRAIPVADELKQAVEQARSRPVSPVYSLISQAIYKNVNAALSGQMSPEDAIKQADSEITKALGTF
jgi:multiple sugar transport system substrate-binding protein